MRKLLLVLCLLVFIACGVYLVEILRPDTTIPTPNVKKTSVKDSTSQAELPEELTLHDKYYGLFEENNDYKAWITIDGTRINYPVMQTMEDNEYYLKRNFNKERNRNGLPFIDNRCDINDPNSNIMIYGHNMLNGTMFSDLLKYDKAEFCQENSMIKFDTLEEEREYEIFAAFYTQIYPDEKVVFKYHQYFGSDDEEEFNDYVKNVKRLSNYKSELDVTFGDELMTLSTCGGVKDVGRFVVVAKRVK